MWLHEMWRAILRRFLNVSCRQEFGHRPMIQRNHQMIDPIGEARAGFLFHSTRQVGGNGIGAKQFIDEPAQQCSCFGLRGPMKRFERIGRHGCHMIFLSKSGGPEGPMSDYHFTSGAASILPFL